MVRYISKYNGRRTSTQIVMWLLEHIVDFELQNGEITEDDLLKEGIRK